MLILSKKFKKKNALFKNKSIVITFNKNFSNSKNKDKSLNIEQAI